MNPEPDLPQPIASAVLAFAESHVEEVPDRWLWWLGKKHRFRPMKAERERWGKEVVGRARIYLMGRHDATADGLHEYLEKELKPKAGALTWIWVASLIVQLVRLWLEWKREQTVDR